MNDSLKIKIPSLPRCRGLMVVVFGIDSQKLWHILYTVSFFLRRVVQIYIIVDLKIFMGYMIICVYFPSQICKIHTKVTMSLYSLSCFLQALLKSQTHLHHSRLVNGVSFTAQRCRQTCPSD